MSEEIIESLATLEKLELAIWDTREIPAEKSVSPSHPRSTHRRASAGGSFSAGNNLTWSSTGKSNSANSIRSANSRYLRASTGSCHDFCKFGHKHSSEEKARVPLHKRHLKPSPIKLNPVQTTVSEEPKNVKVFNRKPPSNTKTQSPLDTKSDFPKSKTSLDKEKAVKHKPSTDSKFDHRKPRTSSGVKTSFRRQTNAPLPKNNPSPPEPPEIIKSVIFPSESVEAKVKQGPLSRSGISRHGRLKASASVKSNPVKVKPALSSEKSDVMHGATSQNTKRLAPPASSLIPKASLSKAGSNRLIKAGNLKPVSPPKVQNRVGDNVNTSNNEKVLEKTLHVIKTEAENNVFNSLPDHAIPSFPPPSSSPPPLSDEEDNKEIDYGDESPEIGKVLSIPDNDNVASSFPPPAKSMSWAESSSSSLSLLEEDDNEIGNDESMEIDELLSVPHVHVVSSIPSSPKSLSQTDSSSPHKEDNREVEYLAGEPGEVILSSDEPTEIGKLLSVLNVHHVSSFPSSPKLLSQADSSPPHEEDDKEIENLAGEPGEVILGHDKSLENDNVESVPDHPGGPHDYIFKTDKPPEIGISHSIPEDKRGIEYHDDGYIPKNYESPEFGISQSIPKDKIGIEYCDDGYISENNQSPKIGISQSILEDQKGIEYHDDEYISENDESPAINNMHPLPDGHTLPSSPKSYADSSLSSYEDVNYSDSELDECIPDKDENPMNNTQRRTRVAISDDNHSSPVKLKFRPGRTIDLQSDNTGPRRLRFRRSRSVETENMNIETKSLRKSGAVNNAGGNETSSERVVLKHQDVMDKKDSQVLLNNVIKETASKLVESRKSKVKALVGAFETVISLQETKPAS